MTKSFFFHSALILIQLDYYDAINRVLLLYTMNILLYILSDMEFSFRIQAYYPHTTMTNSFLPLLEELNLSESFIPEQKRYDGQVFPLVLRPTVDRDAQVTVISLCLGHYSTLNF